MQVVSEGSSLASQKASHLTELPDGESGVNSNMGRHVTGIQNLPPEILECIALHLPPKDYGKFRLTHPSIASSVRSVQEIKSDFYNDTITGKMKCYRKRVLFRAVTAKASALTRKALFRRESGWLDLQLPRLVLSCYYHADFTKNIPVRDVFNAMSPELSAAHRSRYLQGEQRSSLIFDKSQWNQKAVEAIFCKASVLFNQNKFDSGLVLAALMSTLLGHLSEMKSKEGCHIFTQELIEKYRNTWSDMFLAGDVINQFSPTVTKKFTSDDIYGRAALLAGSIRNRKEREVFYLIFAE